MIKKPLISKEALLKIKHQLISQSKTVYEFAKAYYQKLNKRQRIVLFSGVGVIALLLISLSFIHSPTKITKIKTAKAKTDYPVFETKAITTPIAKHVSQLSNNIPSMNNQDSYSTLLVQLDQIKSLYSQQLKSVQDELQRLQSNMSSLASQQDVDALQQTVAEPNKALLGKVDHLQNSVQIIIKQTAQKTWVNPKSVEQYFKLVAVQGFSDGMRAIIDVDGNQTVLSSQEICPVCRGWILQTMDFANQNAVFTKTVNGQQFYVKLAAN